MNNHDKLESPSPEKPCMTDAELNWLIDYYELDSDVSANSIREKAQAVILEKNKRIRELEGELEYLWEHQQKIEERDSRIRELECMVRELRGIWYIEPMDEVLVAKKLNISNPYLVDIINRAKKLVP